jgi:hypothetical protein
MSIMHLWLRLTIVVRLVYFPLSCSKIHNSLVHSSSRRRLELHWHILCASLCQSFCIRAYFVCAICSMFPQNIANFRLTNFPPPSPPHTPIIFNRYLWLCRCLTSQNSEYSICINIVNIYFITNAINFVKFSAGFVGYNLYIRLIIYNNLYNL